VTEAGAIEGARVLLRETASQLSAAGAATEAIASFEPAARRFGVQRRARLRPLGRGWRLGVLLLDADGTVRATGSVTRAVPPGHPGHMAASTEERREVRAAAFRAFPAGATVNFDAPLLDLSPEGLQAGAGPLLLRDGRVLVRWSLSAGDDAARDLAPYLGERVSLLLDPPQGAT
jgi:hypothetical protein